MSLKAYVTNISRGSLHDGPGVRTVVYLKGCPLSCRWCHNPETLSAKRQILFNGSKCIKCGKCIEVCPTHHVILDGKAEYLRNGCTACGRCAEVCPALALTVCGEEMTDVELMREIRKDSHYYSVSGGGVTFSGGECLLHPDLVASIARMCKAEGIGTAVESAMHVPWKNAEAVLPHIDLFFVDLKHPDPDRHREYTGRDNRLIIENIGRLSEVSDNVILRIPVIPSVNDSPEDIIGFAKLLRTFGDGIKGVELLKYNNLAEGKYTVAGATYTKFAEEPQSDAQMETLRALLEEKSGRKCYFS